MNFTELKINGVYLVEVKRIEDERGFFGRSFCQKEFQQLGLNTQIVQSNLSHNKKKGTLRGLHMQEKPFEESKLVRCTRGAIFDVAVDMRAGSETFAQWVGVELTEENNKMLYIPEGFAHGYLTLEDDTDVMYHVSQFYTPASERGFRWNDPAFNIQWPIDPVIISEKDRNQPLLQTDLSKA